jgi:hypothetical protein
MSSIEQNLHRYGRVETGWASRFSSDRFLNPGLMVCPPKTYYDSMGRPADHYSLITTTAGCNSATERVNVEDDQRPSSFTSASLSNIGMEGGYSCDDLKAANEAMAFQWRSAKGGQIPDDRALYSRAARDKQWNDISRKVRYYKYMSGFAN